MLYGDRIQLFVYLNALRSSGNITPQGVFYLLMNNRFVKRDKESKRFMFRGYVNDDDVFDLDRGFATSSDFVSEVYPIKSKTDKNGEVQYTSQDVGHLLSSKGFDDTCDYVMKLTSKAAEEIEEGYIAKSPLNIDGKSDDIVKTCEHCDYKDLCARSKVYARNVKGVSQDEFDTLIDVKKGDILRGDAIGLPKEEI